MKIKKSKINLENKDLLLLTPINETSKTWKMDQPKVLATKKLCLALWLLDIIVDFSIYNN